jgi:ketosteroid isomerase-like protein
VPQEPDPAAEGAVRDWLAGPDLRAANVVCDDEATGQPTERLLDVSECEVSELFSAGEHVAFSAVQSGSYLGGLAGLDDRVGRPARLNLAGLVQVRDGRVVGGRVVRDRLGTARALRDPSEPARA